MRYVDLVVAWVFRLLPAAALFAVLFAVDGPLRWIGLLGVLPLVIGCSPAGASSCATRSCAANPPGYRPWPGH